MKTLRKLLQKNMVGPKGKNRLFIIHWLYQDYFVGWHGKNDETVKTQRIQYPASSPYGYIRVGQSKTFVV